MDFVAIDVETANPNYASICQIGLAKYKNGILEKEWKSFVNPEDNFSWNNVSIHGIDENTVKDAPTFPELAGTLYSFLDGTVAVYHTHFDRTSIFQTAKRYDVRRPDCSWIDSALVARRTWKEFASKGYGLRNVCNMLGYEFKHHDALEDAKAAAHILFAAAEKTGLDVDGWLERVKKPINPKTTSKTPLDGNPEGDHYGEVLVITGELDVTRSDAAILAADVGCNVAIRVTKKTTLFVVGTQDERKLKGHKRSGSHRKADDLIEKGIPIRILNEDDFWELVRPSDRYS